MNFRTIISRQLKVDREPKGSSPPGGNREVEPPKLGVMRACARSKILTHEGLHLIPRRNKVMSTPSSSRFEGTEQQMTPILSLCVRLLLAGLGSGVRIPQSLVANVRLSMATRSGPSREQTAAAIYHLPPRLPLERIPSPSTIACQTTWTSLSPTESPKKD